MTTTIPAPRPPLLGYPRAGRAAHATWRLARAAGRGVSAVAPVVLFTTVLTFMLGALTKQDPASVLASDDARPEDIARIRHLLGVDRPFFVRYFDWLGDALRGDFGESWFTHIPVWDSMRQRLPVSLSIAGFALALALVIGVTLGLVAALNNGGLLDRSITLVAAVLSTIPGFVAAIGLVVVLSVTFPVFPSGGYVSPGTDVAGWVRCLTLPALALSLDAAADLARQLRTGLVATLEENYVVGATMRGLSRRRIVFVHALRNGAGPAVAVLGLHVPRLIGGAIVTETVFVMPGLGTLIRDAALRGDVPVVQGTLLLSVVIVVASSVLFNGLLFVLRPAARREV